MTREEPRRHGVPIDDAAAQRLSIARLRAYVVIDETHDTHLSERTVAPQMENYVAETFDQARSRADRSRGDRLVATRLSKRPERLPDTRVDPVRRSNSTR